MFFNRKKNRNSPLPSPPCNHKWKDFPWYIDAVLYGGSELHVKIVEPYVCIYCKKRKDVILKEQTHLNYTVSKAYDFILSLEEKYKDFIKDEAVVNDMINDMILVDREYLRLYEEVVNNKRKENANV